MTTRTNVQEENLMAAQWLRTPAAEMNDRYQTLEAHGRGPIAFPVSGDLTTWRQYLETKKKPRQY